jgi:hypothetical protein
MHAFQMMMQQQLFNLSEEVLLSSDSLDLELFLLNLLSFLFSDALITS